MERRSYIVSTEVFLGQPSWEIMRVLQGSAVMEEKTADKSAGVVAVVAGLIATVRLARVESREIQSKSPRVRSIVSESITIARMVVEASKANQ